MNNSVNKKIGEVFNDIADGIKSGSFGKKAVIGLTLLGSEHGVQNLVDGALLAAKRDSSVEVVLIGPKQDTELKEYLAETEDEQYKVMEKLLDSGEIDACVTMHYNFPIGVSTVGRVIAPANGREMIISTTTGTSATNRVEAMLRNAVAGIITAKSIGIKEPKVGILNLDGARQVEMALIELKENGFDFEFATSKRADGGAVMRGNDLLMASPDVMVCDSLTGNLLMKVFSSYQTGGSYEAFGYGYGPGVGKNYDRNVLILSRASGSPVVANAILYGSHIVKGGINSLAKSEYEKADKAGLEDIAMSLNKTKEKTVEEVSMPDKEVVTAQLSGIDIMELDDAVQVLWGKGIYAESGMGCTGPIVLVSDKNEKQALEILTSEGYIADKKTDC